jgi:hypothetical protein
MKFPLSPGRQLPSSRKLTLLGIAAMIVVAVSLTMWDWRHEVAFIVIGALCTVSALSVFFRTLNTQLRELERNRASLT